jgi:hypothetical protein
MHLLALLLLAAAPSSSFDGYPTTRGTAGVSVSVSGLAAPTIGATYFLFNDLAARIDIGFNAPLTPGGAGQNTLFSLGGGLRLYPLKHNHVAVFVQPAITAGRENSPAVSAEAAFFFLFGAGIGAEFFFASHFSVGAVLQVALKFANLAGPASTPLYTTLSTATSGLSANIYF